MGYLLDQMEKVASFAEEAMREKLAKNRVEREATRQAADAANEAGHIKNKALIAELTGARDEALAKLNVVRDAYKKSKWNNRALQQQVTQQADALANFKNLGRLAGAAKWIKGNPRTALASAILGGGGLLGGAGAAGYALNNGPKPTSKPVSLGAKLPAGA